MAICEYKRLLWFKNNNNCKYNKSNLGITKFNKENVDLIHDMINMNWA